MFINSLKFHYVEVDLTFARLQHRESERERVGKVIKHVPGLKYQSSHLRTCGNVPGNISWTDASQLDWDGMEESENTCFAIAKDLFFKNGVPQAPKRWPEKMSVPIWTVDGETLPKKDAQQRRLMFSSVIRAFWMTVSILLKQKAEVDLKPTADGLTSANLIDKIIGFRVLATTVSYNFKFLATEQEALNHLTQLLLTVEVLQDKFGLTGFRRILIILEQFRLLKAALQKEPTTADLQTYLASGSNINWGEKGAPKEDVVKVLIEVGRKFKSNKAALSAVEEAQSEYGRDTLFDEWSKVRMLCDKAGANKQDSATPKHAFMTYQAIVTKGLLVAVFVTGVV